MAASQRATEVSQKLISFAGAAAPLRSLNPNSGEFSAQQTLVQSAAGPMIQALLDFRSEAGVLAPKTVVWGGVTQTAVELAYRIYLMYSDPSFCFSDSDAESAATVFASVSTAYLADEGP